MKIKRRSVLKGAIATIASALISKNLPASPLLASFSQFDMADMLLNETLLINAGKGGNNTDDLLLRLEKDCLSHRPELTILIVGTNDMHSQKYIPLEKYERNLCELVLKIKQSGSKVLMATILPVYEPYLLTRHASKFYQPEGVVGRRKQVNAVIRKVANQNECPCLDLEHRFLALGKIGTDPESLLQNEVNSGVKDGVHPTATGYRFIALAIYDAINQFLLPTKRIVCFGDSITFGDGSTDKNSYPAYLKKLLQNQV